MIEDKSITLSKNGVLHKNGEHELPDYKNPNLSAEERTLDLLSRMSLDEKAAQMMCVWNDKKETLTNEKGHFDLEKAKKFYSNGHGIGQIGRPSDAGKHEEATHAEGFGPRETVEVTNAIQKFFIEESRLGIPVFFHEECLHGLASKHATSFPQPIALGGTFNPNLVEQLYTMTAKEARMRGAHQALTPVLDVARDPRWGRVEETFGEDPYLISRMGVAAVKGFQGEADFASKDRVIATLKHFVAHGEPESGQNCGPVNVSERILREVFLMPFKKAIQEAGAISVMPSYNEVDGVPSHANKQLLRDILRDEWGFEGYTVSDYYAILELYDRVDTHGHFLAEDRKKAAELAIKAGLNIEFPEPNCFRHIVELVEEGRLKEQMIDDLVKPLLYWKFKMGLFEHPYNDPEEAERVSGSEDHRPLALQAAQEVITLLQNKDQLLPLDPTKIKKIAVIGPNAHENVMGGYSGHPRQLITALDGIREHLGDQVEVVYHTGCTITLDAAWEKDAVHVNSKENELALIEEAVEVARDADVVVLVVGGNNQTAREAWSLHHMGDRTDLELFGYQKELIAAVAELDKPTVGVVYNGRPLNLQPLVAHTDAILEAWSGGQEGGKALAQILFGEISPSGKLPITIPRNVGQLPMYYNHKPSARRGFLFDDARPLFPFGFGLSYTTFELSQCSLGAERMKKEDETYVQVQIKNTGSMAGSEVIQMYIRDCYSSVTRPVKELKGFEKVYLEPGEERRVRIPITTESLAFYDIDMNFGVESGDFKIMVGTSSRDEDLQVLTLTVD